jgi:hypothetical protein
MLLGVLVVVAIVGAGAAIASRGSLRATDRVVSSVVVGAV